MLWSTIAQCQRNRLSKPSRLRKERNGEEMGIATSVSTFEKFFSKRELRNMAGAGERDEENMFMLSENN